MSGSLATPPPPAPSPARRGEVIAALVGARWGTVRRPCPLGRPKVSSHQEETFGPGGGTVRRPCPNRVISAFSLRLPLSASGRGRGGGVVQTPPERRGSRGDDRGAAARVGHLRQVARPRTGEDAPGRGNLGRVGR